MEHPDHAEHTAIGVDRWQEECRALPDELEDGDMLNACLKIRGCLLTYCSRRCRMATPSYWAAESDLSHTSPRTDSLGGAKT